MLSAKSLLIPTILQTYHDSAPGGHTGFLRTYKRVAQDLFWPNMKNTIKNHVDRCHTCQVNKISSLSPAGLLQPLPIPDSIWEDNSMDFIEGLPKSQGYNCIMVVVDRMSKFAHFILLNILSQLR